MANIWMHNGFLQVEGQKMSKSLGNFLTIREVLRGWRGRPWSGRAVRLLMLKTHYQQPLDWTPERLLEASADLAHYARIISEFKASSTEAYDRAWETPPSEELVSFISDDLNTPEALAYLRRVSNEIDPSSSAMAQLIADIKFLNVLESTNVDAHRASIGSMAWGGFPADLLSKTTPLAFNLKAYVANNDLDMISSTNTELALLGCKPIIGPTGVVTIKYERKPELTVDDLIEKRRLARNAKDWEESDRIRDKLLSMGVKIKDNKDGTTSWEVVR
jgi:cysteinyl-tRNA synthetase